MSNESPREWLSLTFSWSPCRRASLAAFPWQHLPCWVSPGAMGQRWRVCWRNRGETLINEHITEGVKEARRDQVLRLISKSTGALVRAWQDMISKSSANMLIYANIFTIASVWLHWAHQFKLQIMIWVAMLYTCVKSYIWFYIDFPFVSTILHIYIYISAVKWLITINHIQNKRFCLHNICVCVLCIFIMYI